MAILVGGVSELFQADLDFGRRVIEELGAQPWDSDGVGEVLVEDLHYGAVAVAQRLEDVRPGLFVVVGAQARGRPPGTVHRRRVRPQRLEAGRLRDIIADAVTGYVGIDLVTQVAEGLGTLPPRTVAVELEPVSTETSVTMSAAAEDALATAVAIVRTEVRRGPLLELAGRVRSRLAEQRLDPSPVTAAVTALLAGLATVDDQGDWGGTSRHAEQLRRAIATRAASPGTDHLDWAQWWGLVEEIDRLDGVEVTNPAV